MVQSTSIWLFLVFAIFCANLPFLSKKLFLFIRLSKPKSGWWHVLELKVYFYVALGFGLLLENRAGQIAPQGWEFYAVLVTMFITLAFPGFIYRYLLKHRDAP
jgi:hypothetical protein